MHLQVRRNLRHGQHVAALDGHRERLGPEAFAAARRARPLDHVLLELGLDVLGLGLAVAPLEIRDDAFEGRLVGVFAALVLVTNDDLLVLAGVEQMLDRSLR